MEIQKLTAIFYYIKKKKEAPTESAINVDDKTYTIEKMQEFVKKALTMDTAEEITAYAKSLLAEKGLA